LGSINNCKAEHRIARNQMKKSITQSRKHTLDLDPIDYIAAGDVDSSGAVGADHGHDLTQLVWKYFGEEISETLREVQEGLGRRAERLKPAGKLGKLLET